MLKNNRGFSRGGFGRPAASPAPSPLSPAVGTAPMNQPGGNMPGAGVNPAPVSASAAPAMVPSGGGLGDSPSLFGLSGGPKLPSPALPSSGALQPTGLGRLSPASNSAMKLSY